MDSGARVDRGAGAGAVGGGLAGGVAGRRVRLPVRAGRCSSLNRPSPLGGVFFAASVLSV